MNDCSADSLKVQKLNQFILLISQEHEAALNKIKRLEIENAELRSNQLSSYSAHNSSAAQLVSREVSATPLLLNSSSQTQFSKETAANPAILEAKVTLLQNRLDNLKHQENIEDSKTLIEELKKQSTLNSTLKNSLEALKKDFISLKERHEILKDEMAFSKEIAEEKENNRKMLETEIEKLKIQNKAKIDDLAVNSALLGKENSEMKTQLKVLHEKNEKITEKNKKILKNLKKAAKKLENAKKMQKCAEFRAESLETEVEILLKESDQNSEIFTEIKNLLIKR